jgi:hypothetical protein
MDPFAYAMGLIAVQEVRRQFEEIEPARVSPAPAERKRGKLRRLAGRLGPRRGHGAATSSTVRS